MDNTTTTGIILLALCCLIPWLAGFGFAAWYLPRRAKWGILGGLLPAWLRRKFDQLRTWFVEGD